MSKIKVILWDLDDTLLDLKKMQKYSLEKTFNKLYSEELLNDFFEYNYDCWERVAKKEISMQQAITLRFELTFKKHHLELDPAEFNNLYLTNLSKTTFLNDESDKLLIKIHNMNIKQYVATNGIITNQRAKLTKSGIDNLVDAIFISEFMNAIKPDVEYFEYIFKHLGSYTKDEIMMVGDSLTTDMPGAINSGIKSCFYNKKQVPLTKLEELNLKPDYIIYNLNDILDIL